jgi:transposase-like protein
VHLIRNLDFASWKDRRPLVVAIKPFHTAPSAEATEAELAAFETGRGGQRFPTVAAAWDRVIPFFRSARGDLHDQHYRERQCEAAQDHQDSCALSGDEAATKLIWLALRNIAANWGRAASDWKVAMNSSRSSMAIVSSETPRNHATTNLPTASVVRRKRRPPPDTSFRGPRTRNF